jgi:hypothetical protein
MRKYQEFTNLCRAFARLDGSPSVEWTHIAEAQTIMEISMKTLMENFPLDELAAGMTAEDQALFNAIKDVIGAAEKLDLKDLRSTMSAMKSRKFSDKDLERLEKGKYVNIETNPDGSKYVVLKK